MKKKTQLGHIASAYLNKKLPNCFQSGYTIFPFPTAMYEGSSCFTFLCVVCVLVAQSCSTLRTHGL